MITGVKQSARFLSSVPGTAAHMELDFDDSVVTGLHRYVRRVSHALGLRGESSYVQADAPTSAYIALDERFSAYPDHDVALLWDERHGWSAAIEPHTGTDLLPVARLGEEVVPAPETVAAWTKSLFGPARYHDERPDDESLSVA